MLLDIILVALLVLACIKGFQRGLIVGAFSFIAIIVGLAAAMKLSNLVANYLGENVKISDRWLPVISFAIIFIVFVLIIRLLANLIQKTVELAMLGWVNRIGGILLYIAIFIIVYSVVLFYAEQIHIINDTTIQNSVTYSFVQPWGPKVINGIGSVIPYFRDMFGGLENFFEHVAEKAQTK